ncbi:MAG: hypothetical protein WBA76_15880 [Phormidesmis sp.]
MPLQTAPTIKSISIPLLLDWWQQRKRIASARSNLHRTRPTVDDTYLQAYYRLMEVYSVVKAGGVAAQVEAVHAFAKRESQRLQQRLDAIATAKDLTPDEQQQQRQQLQQELTELHSANDWRLQMLKAITPDEEALVQQYLAEIERTLMQAKCD